MPFPNRILSDQRGAALVIVMLVLTAVTVLGLASINISTVELNLVGNDKFQKTGFYNGDSGLHGSPPVIAPVFNDDPPLQPADPNDPNDEGCLQYLNGLTPADFGKMLFLHVGVNGCDPNQPAFKDISFRGCKVNADIDICPTEAKHMSGGGVEFARGAEGLGLGGGSKANYFRIVSTGDGDSPNTTYTVSGHYRWTEESGGMK